MAAGYHIISDDADIHRGVAPDFDILFIEQVALGDALPFREQEQRMPEGIG